MSASTEALASINTAIAAIEGGAQEYQIGTRKIVRADLSVLYSERQRLEDKVNAENTSGNTFVAVFDRR